MTNEIPPTPIDLTCNPLSLQWPSEEQLEVCRSNVAVLMDAQAKALKEPDQQIIILPPDVPLLVASLLTIGMDLGRQKILLEQLVQGYRFYTA